MNWTREMDSELEDKNGSQTKHFMTPQKPTTYDGRRMCTVLELAALEPGWNLMSTQV